MEESRGSQKYLGTPSNNFTAVNIQNLNLARNNSIINSQKSDDDTGNNY